VVLFHLLTVKTYMVHNTRCATSTKPKIDLEMESELKTSTRSSSCAICYKATSCVLRNDHDFFFVCSSHLTDASFCKKIPKNINTPNVQPSSQYFELHGQICFTREKRLRDKLDYEKKMALLSTMPDVQRTVSRS
jgi:AAA-ATPase Vps4-associated protein 1